VASPGVPLSEPGFPPGRGPHDPGTRAGRFHSARGPMPLSGWLRYPAARRRAKRGVVPERPWIVPAAIGWLRRRIRGDWSVLELGAGRSTPWVARRAGDLVSFEDNPHWFRQTADRLHELGLEVDLRLIGVEDFPREVEALADASFDLVVVDFLEAPEVTRVDVLKPAMKKVGPEGLLLLDDSDRPGYAEAYDLLAGWKERRFVGVKDGWPEVCETTIFRRPT
jgi:predicted O-methyltransferase YrrM